MKWKDHRRITLEICRFFGLDNASDIAEASVLPDKEPDYYWTSGRRRVYRKRVPHHEKIAVETAFKYLKEARKRYLNNSSFAEPLGRALHYLQDYSIDPTEKLWIFSFRSDSAHDEREGSLQHLPIDFDAVKEAVGRRCYPYEFKSMVYSTKRGKNAEEIISVASYLTSLAVKLIVNPDKPENLKENYRRALKLHVAVLLVPWTLLVFGFSYAIVSAILSLIIHAIDVNYTKWRTAYQWFEVKT